MPRRLDRAAQLADIVAERLAEPARLEEIALHVDDQQRRGPRLQRKLVGLGIDERHGPLQQRFEGISKSAANRASDTVPTLDERRCPAGRQDFSPLPGESRDPLISRPRTEKWTPA